MVSLVRSCPRQIMGTRLRSNSLSPRRFRGEAARETPFGDRTHLRECRYAGSSLDNRLSECSDDSEEAVGPSLGSLLRQFGILPGDLRRVVPAAELHSFMMVLDSLWRRMSRFLNLTAHCRPCDLVEFLNEEAAAVFRRLDPTFVSWSNLLCWCLRWLIPQSAYPGCSCA